MSQIQQEFKDLITTMVIQEPMLGMIVKSVRVILMKDTSTSYTDGKKIVINPEFFSMIKPKEKLVVLFHGAMHIARLDPMRMMRYNTQKSPIIAKLYNILADAKINDAIENEILGVKIENGITCRMVEEMFKISIDDCKRKSVEELIDMILKRFKESDISQKLDGVMLQIDIVPSSGEEGNEKCDKQGEYVVILNNGDPDIVNASPEELRKKILKILMTQMVLKTAGNIPSWAQRIIDELVKPKIDWRSKLMKYLRLGFKVRVKLTKLNRKNEELLGKQFYGKSKVVVLLDTSGSILEEELKQFVSEVRAMVPISKNVVVIPFDATTHGEFVVKNDLDVAKLKLKLEGGGGTVIRPALELVMKKYRNSDSVIILTDGDIYDINDPITSRMLRSIANKLVFVTTHSDPPKFIRNVIHINVDDLKRE